MSWWDRVTQWNERHRFGIDIAVTSVTGSFLVVLSGPLGAGELLTGFWAFATWAPLAWRRRNPVASVVLVYSAGLLHLFLGAPTFLPTDLAVLIALYSVTVYGPRWAHLTAIVGAMVGSLLLSLNLLIASRPLYSIEQQIFSVVSIAIFCGMCAIATWAFGLMRRARRETLVALRDRAERLEVERDQQARIATAAERTRIAREMHDIVAHSLSVVIAQADGGRYAAAADPDAAVRALGTISETGRAALADMRRLLGVLRAPEGTPALPGAPEGTAVAPVAPQPAAQDLEQLVEQVRASGVNVSLVRMGTARALPPGTGLAAYRITQEALTNVMKHAGPGPTVTVLVQWLPAALLIEVTDDGRGAAADSDGAGHGLLGMRERAAMFGGTVSTGPRPGGGFRVRAEIPLPPAPGPAPAAAPLG
jgi:signal transduction histidine kinase